MRFQLITATFTPLEPTGSLKLDIIPSYLDYLVERRVDGVFVCGTTGEGSSLTTDEREAVAAAWLAARDRAGVDLKVFVHVGNESLPVSLRLARHAADMGADAVALLSPVFFKPSGEEAVVDHAAAVAAAASQTPFYYYHLPAMTGLAVSMPRVVELARESIPNFAGIKFTHADLGEFLDCMALAGDALRMYFGRDELLLFGLQAGAPGAVGSTYNFAAPLYLRLVEAHARGDSAEAIRLQWAARQMIDAIVSRGGLAAQKRAMAHAGLDCGPVRSPLRQIKPEDDEALRRVVENLAENG
jgi:N-acetylneuraminate lyase